MPASQCRLAFFLLTGPAGRHVGFRNSYFQIWTLFRNRCLRLWVPHPSEQGGFDLAPCMSCLSKFPPGKLALPDPDEEQPPGKRHPPPTRPCADPSGRHHRRCLAPAHSASGFGKWECPALSCAVKQNKAPIGGAYELPCVACYAPRSCFAA